MHHTTHSSGIKGGESSSPANGHGSSAYETFAFMVVEEFLMKKGMASTLQSFRQEWTRPDEFTSTVSWYDIALKLHLQDLQNTDKVRQCSVLDNLVQQVVRDATVRSRRDGEIIVSGLATLPRTLPILPLDNTSNAANTSAMSNNNNAHNITGNSNNHNNYANNNTNNISALSLPPHDENAETKDSNKYKLAKIENKKMEGITDQLLKSKLESFKNQDNNKEKKVSSENWVPEVKRMQSIQRDLETLKENLNDIRLREITQEKELKRFQTTDLERARVEESLGSTKKVPCACCLQKFLYCNLPLKVSQKAIVDIRIKWSGMLNSKTIFEGVSSVSNEDSDDLAATGNSDGKGSKELGKKKMPSRAKSDDRINAIPRCYDEVLVCNFCAQFFHDQAEYRPSFDLIVQNEKKTIYMEHKKKELEYWDPLKMVTKDRELKEKNWSQKDEEEEALLRTMLGTSLQAAARQNLKEFTHNSQQQQDPSPQRHMSFGGLAHAEMVVNAFRKKKNGNTLGDEYKSATGNNNTILEED